MIMWQDSLSSLMEYIDQLMNSDGTLEEVQLQNNDIIPILKPIIEMLLTQYELVPKTSLSFHLLTKESD